jgi:hypothetical protein
MFTFLLSVPLNTGAKCVGYLMFTVIQMINQRIFPDHSSQIVTVTMLSQLSYSKHWVNKEHLHRKKKGSRVSRPQPGCHYQTLPGRE